MTETVTILIISGVLTVFKFFEWVIKKLLNNRNGKNCNREIDIVIMKKDIDRAEINYKELLKKINGIDKKLDKWIIEDENRRRKYLDELKDMINTVLQK